MQANKIGIVGGGQLAQMMALAAAKLKLEVVVQTPTRADPAVAYADAAIIASIDDAKATEQMVIACDVVTFENEFVDLVALEKIDAQLHPFYPSIKALTPLLDKYKQRQFLSRLGISTPQFRAVEIDKRVTYPVPVAFKSRRFGYDGYGTFIITTESELAMFISRFAGDEMLLEEYIPFDRELAIIVTRDPKGNSVVYPLVETQQVGGVCRRVFLPADCSPEIIQRSENLAKQIVNALDAVGTFAIELFLTKSGELLVNEIAPRVHNSGHYTIEATDVSQFTQHLLAISGRELIPPQLTCANAVMVNLLGYEDAIDDYRDKRDRLAAIEGSHVHWYGKPESREGRKLGHVTICLQDIDRSRLLQIATEIESIWYER
jgi:5-(carboxyamino)imidazole ribonucleotide synthase